MRRALWCGYGCEHRKQWIEDRLRELDSIFAVEVAAYVVLDNDLHVVLRPDDTVAVGWLDEDVVRPGAGCFSSRKGAAVSGRFGSVGAGSVEGCEVGGGNSQTTELSGLVHEVPEGTAGSHVQQRRQVQRHVL